MPYKDIEKRNRKALERYYKNREEKLAWQNNYYETHKEKAKEYRRQNKERNALASKKYSKTEKGKIAKRRSIEKYEKTERGKYNRLARKLRYKARKLNQLGPNPPTPINLKDMLARPCAYCDGMSEHIDHIVPLSRDGLHDISNVTGACAKCNLEKGAKLLSEWINPPPQS